MKRTIGVLLSAILSFTAAMPVFAEEITADDVNEIILSEDFESYKAGDTPEYSVSSAKGITVQKTDDHTNAMTFSSATGSLMFNYDFDKPLSGGAYLMGFDYMADGSGKLTYIRLRNIRRDEGPSRDNYFETIGFNEKMRVLTYPNTRGWSGTDRGEYKAGQWYHIDMWFDFDTKIVYYYIDNQFAASTSMHNDLNDIAGFTLGVEKASGTQVYIDNLKTVKVNYADKLGIPADAVPESLKGSASVTVKTEKLGNIFTGSETPVFNLGISNRDSVGKNFEVRYSAADSDGRVFWAQKESVVLSGKEQKNKQIKIDSARYGCHVFSVSVTDPDTGDVSAADTEFSVINSPSVPNDKWGATIHTQYHYMTPETVDIMAKCGIGYVRTNANWATYEKSKGNYKIPDEFVSYFKKITESGMKIVTGTMGTNPTVYPTAIPPATAEDLEAYGNYATRYVTDFKPYSNAFEVWNEYNLEGSGFNPNSEPPEKYAELLKTAYDKMKAANPEAFVIGFVTSGTPNAWIERVFKALNGADCFDAISVHPYSMKISPEDGNLVSRIESLRALMNQYNYGDKELWATEIGWPNVDGYVTAENQARFNVRAMLLNDSHKLFDKVIMYQVSDSGLREDYSEHHFGLVKSWFSELKVPYAAKPAYAAMSNFNKLAGNAEFVKTIAEGGEYYAYQYKNGNESDTDVIVAGAYGDSQTLSLDLGCDSVTVYDMYGNSAVVSGTNGKYTFLLGEDMCYIEGRFSKAEMCRDVVRTDVTKIRTTQNTRVSVNISSTGGSALTAELKSGRGIEPVGCSQTDGTVRAEFEVGGTAYDNDNVIILVSSGSGRIADFKIPVQYLMSADIESFDVEPYSVNNMRHLVGKVKIKNNRKDIPIDGRIVFSSPDRLRDNINEISVQPIGIGETQIVRFNIPENKTGEKNKLSAQLLLSNGEEYTIGGNILYATATKTDTPPKIDGVTDDGEWNSKTTMILSGEGMSERVNGSKYGGANDLSGKAKLLYDDDYLYFCCDVTDNVFSQRNDLTYIWKGDGIQIGTAYTAGAKTSTEIGLALTPAGSIAYGYSSEHGYAANQLLTECKVSIKNNGTKTVYEAAIPWKHLLPEGVTADSVRQFYFSMLINDNDGGDRLGWLEYGSGVGRAKDTTQFVKTVLVNN